MSEVLFCYLHVADVKMDNIAIPKTNFEYLGFGLEYYLWNFGQ